ncbi:YebC/PmpR family DNA-binding transcriptional regulator [Idiomarina sp. PL1-037]|uniref:YebC/PmpR family DNA-binding transcriptional regulator n=1 Tax=unclassified Idiomarina TaxID=2614829 RepID=UPI00294AE722|nr:MULTISPECIES: YebC/PmpR family DNA-binding transcriptional regulator [unclassified Idiomarina]MDV6328685.1 YebC/PmpR family DNA-binding transcriptional regulator [Idiomarina sp. Sol25]WQC53809.1 YebC/PmpR family DNA-binding transcriptional regulator [Idiomarina sp. PL1-037]
MAGHSKWSNIKHRKAAQDAKRGKIFTKLIREITVSAREGGGDPETNPRLRAAIDKALSNNMKRDTIDTAVKRGSGDLEGENVDELTYEGYGPNGVAVLLECMTDNRNRTVSDVRHAFSKLGGNLGTDGSVAYLFNKKGVISYADNVTEEQVMEPALEAGAEDILTYDEGSIDVITSPENFGAVKDALDAKELEASNAEVTQVPDTRVDLDEESARTFLKLLDALEDLDDVQNVYHNADISDEIIARLDD